MSSFMAYLELALNFNWSKKSCTVVWPSFKSFRKELFFYYHFLIKISWVGYYPRMLKGALRKSARLANATNELCFLYVVTVFFVFSFGFRKSVLEILLINRFICKVLPVKSVLIFHQAFLTTVQFPSGSSPNWPVLWGLNW